MKVLALIDADSLVYQSLRDSLEESLSVLDHKINNIVEKTKCTHYALFVSTGGNYFRKKVADSVYKKNRDKYQIRQWTKTLKAILEDRYHANNCVGVEADDLVLYWYNKPLFFNGNSIVDSVEPSSNVEEVTKILCSIDKDLLKTVPGKHFNYTFKTNPENNETIMGQWIETTEEEAEEFLLKQLVTGDSTDNIIGLPGKGEVFWNKWKKAQSDKISIGNILDLYCKEIYSKSKAIKTFYNNFTMLYMLRTPEDFEANGLELPSFPFIHTVLNNQMLIDVEF